MNLEKMGGGDRPLAGEKNVGPRRPIQPPKIPQKLPRERDMRLKAFVQRGKIILTPERKLGDAQLTQRQPASAAAHPGAYHLGNGSPGESPQYPKS